MTTVNPLNAFTVPFIRDALSQITNSVWTFHRRDRTEDNATAYEIRSPKISLRDSDLSGHIVIMPALFSKCCFVAVKISGDENKKIFCGKIAYTEMGTFETTKSIIAVIKKILEDKIKADSTTDEGDKLSDTEYALFNSCFIYINETV